MGELRRRWRRKLSFRIGSGCVRIDPDTATRFRPARTDLVIISVDLQIIKAQRPSNGCCNQDWTGSYYFTVHAASSTSRRPVLNKRVSAGLAGSARVDIGLTSVTEITPRASSRLIDVAGLDALVIGGVRHDDALARSLGQGHHAQGSPCTRFQPRQSDSVSTFGIGDIKVPAGVFFFGLLEHIAIRSAGSGAFSPPGGGGLLGF